jgi:uncharacterized protein (DUF488 family)
MIWTIGHSTRTLDELVALLAENGVKRLADIRRYAGSRRHPHFAGDALAATLPERGIAYVHMPELGGRRKPALDSPNGAWRNEQFRGYADHMATAEFREAVDRLLAFAERTAVMCAEAVPWRCHRNLLADDLFRRGVEVRHIIGAGEARAHEMGKDAVVEGDRIVYPPTQRGLGFRGEL